MPAKRRRTPFHKLKAKVGKPLAPGRPLGVVTSSDPTYQPNGYGYLTAPLDHQRRALKASAGKPYFGLFMTVGTGKTKVLIDTAAFLYQRKAIDRMLVLAPNGVHLVWPEEFEKHCPTWVPRTVITFRSDWSPKQAREVEEQLRYAPAGLLVAAMNIESLSSLSGKAFLWASRFLQGGPALLVVDESQRIKGPSSVRSKAVLHLAQYAPYRRLATGTEITKGFEDLYSQFRVLHPDIIGQPTFTAFKSEYCLTGGFENREIIAYRNTAGLIRKIAPYIFTQRLEDAVDMPERIYQRRIVELSPEQRRLYKALVDDTLAEIRSGVVVSEARAAVKLVRLRQIVSGHVSAVHEATDDRPEHTAIERLPNPRMQTLIDLVTEEVHGKFLLWAAFKEDIRWIIEELTKARVPIVSIYGGQTDTENERARQAFKDPAIRGLVAIPEKAGTGFTFNEATTSIYYSHSFNYEARLQSEGRNYRIGQKNRVLYIDLLAARTVDLSKLLPSREKKQDMATLIKDPDRFRALMEEAAAMLDE